MKKLYAEQKHSIYYIQKKLGLSLYSLYHYTRTHNIKNMPLRLILDIAYIEGVEPNWLYERMIDYEKKNKGIDGTGNKTSEGDSKL